MSPSITVALPTMSGGLKPEELYKSNQFMMLATALHFNNVKYFFLRFYTFVHFLSYTLIFFRITMLAAYLLKTSN